MDLWKQAYQAEFGNDPDEDMAEYASDVEAWRTNWLGGYNAGEEWATRLLAASSEEQDDQEEAEP